MSQIRGRSENFFLPLLRKFGFKSGCWLHLQAKFVAPSFQGNSGLTKQPKKHLGPSEQQSATDLLSTHNVCLLTFLFHAIPSSKKNLVWGWCVLFWLSEVYDSLFSCILLMESATEVAKCITGICVNRIAERRWCCAVYLGENSRFSKLLFLNILLVARGTLCCSVADCTRLVRKILFVMLMRWGDPTETLSFFHISKLEYCLCSQKKISQVKNAFLMKCHTKHNTRRKPISKEQNVLFSGWNLFFCLSVFEKRLKWKLQQGNRK